MKKIILTFAVFLAATLSSSAADTVELLPGKITGAITLSSDTIKNGQVYANATDGSGSANASFTGSTYSILVPAGKTWKLNFTIYTEVPAVSGAYAYISVNLPTEISVGADETVTNDIPLSSARVQADVQVANGTLDLVSIMRASGNSGGSNSTYFNYYSQNVDYAVVLPMANISVYGSATVTSSAGDTSAQTLPNQTLDVSAGGATATWELDASFAAGAIVGDVTLTGADTPTGGNVQLYNSSNTRVGLTNLQGNGPFEFTNLIPGSYRLYNYAYFSGSQLYFYENATPAEAGVITRVDFVHNLGMALVDINPTGFLTRDAINGGYSYGNWTAPNPNPNQQSRAVYAQFDTTTDQFSGAVTPGEWKFDRINISGYDHSTPGVYLNYGLGVYDYRAAKTTFEGGETKTVASFDFDTTQTELTFDVIEPAGATAETLITNAQVNGYVTTYVDGAPDKQLSFNSSASTSGAQPRQRVRIVGIPGTYNVQTYGYVEGSRVSFGNFTLELKEPLPTPVGTGVTVTAGTGVDLVFDNVTTAGVSTAAQLPVGPALPGGYTTVLNNDVTAYYSISTTATFDGYIDVTISYTDDTVPPEQEADLKLFYFDDATQTWIDITIEVDEANNTITGTAPALALFAIGVPNAPTISDIVVPTEVLAGEEFSVTALLTDSDQGEQHTATFDWGDGTTAEGVINAATGEIAALHTYEQGGAYEVTLTVIDATGNVVEESFTIEVEGNVDSTPPEFALTALVVAEATGPDGAVVEFDIVATDETDGAVTVETSIESGAVFPLGTTTVTATATDAAGNEATLAFDVVVQDTTAPEISALADLVIEASDANGAIATFEASATDIVSQALVVAASAESGSVFPIGTTVVTLETTDEAGNPATAQFSVTVQDTSAPEITVPTDIVVEATGPDGAAASFEVSATDDVSGEIAVESSAASGSTFALGATTVTLSAADAAGNTASGSFTVTVQDTTAPDLSAPANLVLEATSVDGATATFTASASDLVSGEVTVEASLVSGSTFALGTTTVELTATDAAGNASTGSFTVTVQDTTAPEVVSLAPSVGTLWPANHKMVAVSFAIETNDVGGAVTSRIVSIVSNEPDNGKGDGNTINDTVITGDLTANLRAERAGKGTGRVYTITVESTDAAGNVTTSITTVEVPKSQKSDKSAKSEKGKSDKSDKSEKSVKAKSDKSEKSSKAQSKKRKKSKGKG